ncbi:MAG: hypothetical protein ABI091_30455 [Ferruginibacter sp.]
MTTKFKNILGVLAILIILVSCKKTTYTLGDLTAPANVAITAVPVGQDATHPNGDGSGDVKITVTSDYALSYKIQYDASGSPEYVPSGTATHKYADIGTTTHTITAIVYGKGGSSTSATKDVTVRFDYVPDPTVVTDLTGDASKTWIVDKSVPGQLGVGPWAGSSGPDWWQAGINEKVGCCNCFYTAQYKFIKNSATSYSLTVTSPDGVLTKTGALTTIPGIPSIGDEGCYNYGGGTSAFSFLPASSGIANSTKITINLAGTATFIGYGAVLKSYEILSITPTAMYLRVQGTETGNAWYLKLKSI